MQQSDLGGLSVAELAGLYASVIRELRAREIVRTGNGLAGDYSEVLFARTFDWKLEGNSAKSYDAVGEDGQKYQIKGRFLANPASARQLSTIRSIEQRGFDWLAICLFDSDYAVLEAGLVPYELVKLRGRPDPHVNGWRFMAPRVLWRLPGVKDATAALRATQSNL